MAMATPNPTHRIVLLHGKDAFLRSEYTRQLQSSLREAHGEVDEISFDGQTAGLAAVLDEARTTGLLCSHKLIVVDNAEAFIGAEERRRALERYAESPESSATLLLRAATWRPGNFDKLVATVGIALKCEPPPASSVARWAVQRAGKRHDCLLQSAAAELLVDRLGADLGRVDMELGKLAVLALVAKVGSEPAVITREHVQALVGASREEQAWAIQEPVLAGNSSAAIVKANELISVARAPEVMVAWAVIDLWRKVHSAAELLKNGVPEPGVAKALRLWGDSVGPVISLGKRVGPIRAAKALHRAVAIDRAMKSGFAPEPLRAIECMILETMCIAGLEMASS